MRKRACAAYRAPAVYGSLALMSGSFVFTDVGSADHGGGPLFDPVVQFVNRYRERPRRVADRLFVSCGVFEPLIVRNRSMVPTFEAAGMGVRFVETRDGHTWENWRDTLREGDDGVVRAHSKFIGFPNEGPPVTGDYHDEIVRTPAGWRLRRRRAEIRRRKFFD